MQPLTILLTLNVACISESCIEIKIKWNFYFHTSLWCLRRFYKGIGTGRVNSKRSAELHLSRYSHENLHDCTFNNFLSFFLFCISETYFHFIILVIFYFAWLPRKPSTLFALGDCNLCLTYVQKLYLCIKQTNMISNRRWTLETIRRSCPVVFFYKSIHLNFEKFTKKTSHAGSF